MQRNLARRALLALALAVLCAAALGAQTLLDPASQPKYINPLPNPLDNVLVPDTTTYPGYEYYKVTMTQFRQALGIVDPITLVPMSTTVWGYNGTYPGPTFEATAGQPVKARFANNLVDSLGIPLPHLLPLDTTVHCGTDQLGNPTYCRPFVRTVAHLHGGHVADHSDGNPEAWFSANWTEKGPRWSRKIYDYPNDQEAATLWYHDHALGITRLNVYAGLAGFYLLRDTLERSLQNQHYLPKYPYEIPMVIQDRSFYADGSLAYPKDPWLDGNGNPASLDPLTGRPVPSIQPEFFGDFILVNGKTWPVLDVEPRIYRFRLLNGSEARFYDLRLAVVSGTTTKPPMVQIGSDGGFLNAPVPFTRLLLAPGERADVLVDFSQSQGLVLNLTNSAETPYPGGPAPDPATTGKVMQLRVVKPLNLAIPDTLIPATLRSSPIPALTVTPGVPDREVLLAETADGIGRVLPLLGTKLLGPLMWDDPVTETPKLGTTERWVIINSTQDTHPVHLHLVQFQVINREGIEPGYDPADPSTFHLTGNRQAPAANEKGWKDTVQAPPGKVTRVIAKFDLAGLYVWHCHILDHEDNEMMRPLQVVP